MILPAPRLLVLALGGWLLAACGAQAPPPAGASFPVRLLPARQESTVVPLLEADFSDLAGWQVLDFQRKTLVPARGHPGVVQHEGAVYLQEPWLFLVRLVDVPAGVGHSLVARLRTDQPFEPGDVCAHLLMPLVQDSLPGESAEGVLRAGVARGGPGKELPLGELLPARLERSFNRTSCAWTTPAGADGFAQARFKLTPQDGPQVRAVVLSAITGPVGVTSLRIEPKPELDRLVTVGSTGSGTAALQEPAVLPVRAAMEWRPSLVVPPGREHVLEAEVPAGARALSFGVVVDPLVCAAREPQPPPRAQWRVELAWEAADAPVLLGQGDVGHDGQSPPFFQDVRLAWPAAFPGGVAARLRFSVEGDAAVVFGQPLVRGPGPDRPNVLVVSLDTVRADHLGYHGYGRPTSPALDRLAQESAAFLNAYSVGPYTLPTHVTLFTGLLPPHHGVTDSWADRLDANAQPYLPRLLGEAGWVTAGFTGGGFLSADFGFAEGYDLYRPVDPVIHHGSAFNQRRYARNQPPHVEAIERAAGIEQVADWIAAHDDAPWFAFVHTYAPHEYDPPAEVFALFDTAPGSDWGTDAADIAQRLKPTEWPVNPPSPADVEHLVNLYDGALRFTDDRFGNLLALLERRGLLEDTVLVVTSDHGEELFEHGGLRHSVTLYEEMLHVPLLIQLPGAAPRRILEPVSIADVTPTILEALGLPVPEGTDGRSLLGLVQGTGSPDRAPVLLGHVDTGFSRRASLRHGRLKVIEGDTSDQVKFPARAPWELYDLAADPGETTNLAEQRPDDLERLRRSLEAVRQSLRARSVEGGEANISPEVMEHLEQLGYLGGDG